MRPLRKPSPGIVVRGAFLTAMGCLGRDKSTGSATLVLAVEAANSKSPVLSSPDDFRNRSVKLGLANGGVHELAMLGASRHPPDSNPQLALNGFTVKPSMCARGS
jgi:hypothetical protein